MTSPQKGTVAASGLAGAVVVILVWLLSLAKITVPNEVAGALTALIGAGLAWLVHEATPIVPVPIEAAPEPVQLHAAPAAVAPDAAPVHQAASAVLRTPGYAATNPAQQPRPTEGER